MRARLRAADLLALVPGLAAPAIFLHRNHQPHLALGSVDVYGSDVAAWAVIAAAVAAGVAYGFGGLAQTRWLWLAALAYVGVLGLSCFWTPLDDPARRLVTWGKLAEYALLGPALVLLLRTRLQVDRFLALVVAWGVAASAWGALQFLGVAKTLGGTAAGGRQESFLGVHDFGAFSGAVLMVGVAGLVLGERSRLAAAALVAGAVGVVLAASVFVYLGVFAAAAVAIWLALRAGALELRRGLVLGGMLLVIAAGVVGLRTYDVSGFLSFVGGDPTEETLQGVQTGSQRATLAYIGLRIWLDHPLLGVGFDRSDERYEPYLDDARRRFPDQPDEAFPSPEHEWGVQNSWVQLLADVGVVGLALALATFALGLRLAVRARREVLFLGIVAAGWILVAAGTWNGLGLVAGLPFQAVTWLGLGLAATVVTVR